MAEKKKNPWIPYLGVLALLLLWFVYSQFREQRYEVKIEPLFDFPYAKLAAFSITQDSATVTLLKADSVWVFAAPDTGSPAAYKIEQFLKDVVRGEREGHVTDDTSRYEQYGVSADKGIRVELRDATALLARVYVGRSVSDFNQEFVRYEGDPRVYLSRQRIVGKLGATATWWR